jgi:hypothetical protein
VSANEVFATGHTYDDQAVHVLRRDGHAVTLMPIINSRFPQLMTGVLVEGHQCGVEAREIQPACSLRHSAIVVRAA